MEDVTTRGTYEARIHPTEDAEVRFLANEPDSVVFLELVEHGESPGVGRSVVGDHPFPTVREVLRTDRVGQLS